MPEFYLDKEADIGLRSVQWLGLDSWSKTVQYRKGGVHPLLVDNELSNNNSWKEAHEKVEATLRPRIQDISSGRT